MVKSLGDFYKHTGRVVARCKDCYNRASSAYRKAAQRDDPERMRSYGKRYRDKNPDKRAAARREWRAQNPEHYRALNAKHNAKAATKALAAVASVYFVQTESGPIKIGYTSATVESRLIALQTGSFETLTILGRMNAASFEDEAAVHKRFAHLRIRRRGEWFRPGADLLAFIAENASHEHRQAERSAVSQEAAPGVH